MLSLLFGHDLIERRHFDDDLSAAHLHSIIRIALTRQARGLALGLAEQLTQGLADQQLIKGSKAVPIRDEPASHLVSESWRVGAQPGVENLAQPARSVGVGEQLLRVLGVPGNVLD